MADVQVVKGGQFIWDLFFLRHFQDWEVNNIKELL